jgi:hypothetical protein
MNSTIKIVNLWLFFLFTLIFISPLMADPPEPQPGPQGAEPERRGSLLEPQPGSQGEDYNDYDSLFFEAPPLILEVPGFEPRSFDDVFPGLSQGQKMIALSGRGVRNSFEKDDSPTLLPAVDSGINLLGGVMAKKPSHIIEALALVPYNKRELDLLDIYNALRKIKNIQDHTIPSRGNNVKVFLDTTRIESAQRRRPIPDPPRVDTLPNSEIMFLRFSDRYLGDLYIRANISIGLYGITYSLSNFRDVSFSIFRIMKAESFSTVIYLEPVIEGILIYSMSGIYIPSFIAHRVNLPSNMNYRITVLVNWITEGLREEENYSKHNYFYRQ